MSEATDLPVPECYSVQKKAMAYMLSKDTEELKGIVIEGCRNRRRIENSAFESFLANWLNRAESPEELMVLVNNQAKMVEFIAGRIKHGLGYTSEEILMFVGQWDNPCFERIRELYKANPTKRLNL